MLTTFPSFKPLASATAWTFGFRGIERLAQSLFACSVIVTRIEFGAIGTRGTCGNAYLKDDPHILNLQIAHPQSRGHLVVHEGGIATLVKGICPAASVSSAEPACPGVSSPAALSPKRQSMPRHLPPRQVPAIRCRRGRGRHARSESTLR